MRNFKELFVWQKSIDLVVYIYGITRIFPPEEKYGLANQMRRAAISIASNIAEGHMRFTDKDFGQFLAVARGSCAELETQSIIARRLRYIDEKNSVELTAQINEAAKMLASFHSRVNKHKTL